MTKWVEDSVAGVKGVKHILSTITEGSSVTTIEFRLEVNTDRAVNDVKDAVSKIRMNLPRTIDEPIINRVEIAGLPIMIYGASAPAMTPEDLSWFVDDVVARSSRACAASAGSSASAVSRARCASPCSPTGCWRWASPPPT